jgi:hypothetical protein
MSEGTLAVSLGATSLFLVKDRDEISRETAKCGCIRERIFDLLKLRLSFFILSLPGKEFSPPINFGWLVDLLDPAIVLAAVQCIWEPFGRVFSHGFQENHASVIRQMNGLGLPKLVAVLAYLSVEYCSGQVQENATPKHALGDVGKITDDLYPATWPELVITHLLHFVQVRVLIGNCRALRNLDCKIHEA